MKNIQFYFFLFIVQFNFTLEVLAEKPLFVVVTSFNNEKWVTLNLDSIFCQKYSNFHVFYMDDCSSDRTVELVRSYIKERNLENKLTIFANNTREWKFINLYRIYYLADDWDIIVQIDGDDMLAHSNVFNTINDAFTKDNAWITYGGYQRVRWKKPPLNNQLEYFGPIQPTITTLSGNMQNNKFRSTWYYMHLHAFYAWLFKLIKLQDLVTTTVPGFEGKLFPFANDQAMVYPMMEMASWKHIYRFKERTYLGSMPEKRGEDQKVNWQPIQEACVKEVVSGHRYQPLSKPVLRSLDKYCQCKATLMVMCTSMPSFDYLDSVKNVIGLETICLITENVDKNGQDLLQKIINTYKNIKHFNISSSKERSLFVKFFNELKTNYIVLSDTQHNFDTQIDIGQSIYLLEKTFAYAFYLDHALEKLSNVLHSTRLEGNTYLWKFVFNKNGWKHANTTTNILYRKNDVNSLVASIEKDGIKGLEHWRNMAVDKNKLGLFNMNSI